MSNVEAHLPSNKPGMHGVETQHMLSIVLSDPRPAYMFRVWVRFRELGLGQG